MGWRPSRLLLHLPVLSSLCTRKPRKWQVKIRLVGVTPWAPPCAYSNRRWGNNKQQQQQLFYGSLDFVWDNPEADKRWENPNRMQYYSVLGCRIELMITQGLMDCKKAGDFRSIPGNKDVMKLVKVRIHKCKFQATNSFECEFE